MARFHCISLLLSFVAATSVAAAARAAEPAPEPRLPLPVLTADALSTPAQQHHHIGDNFAARRLAVFGQTGIGGPYGLLGFSVDYSFSRFASAEVGMGAGGTAPELSAMLYPRIPLSTGFAIGGGFGVTGAPDWKLPWECWMDENPCTQHRWNFAAFGNAELSLEGRTRSGFSVRGYVGGWKMLNPSDGCSGKACTLNFDATQPYFGVAFGGSMSL